MIDNDSFDETLLLKKNGPRLALLCSSLTILLAFLFGTHDALLRPASSRPFMGDKGWWSMAL
jgi:hypothetical protein